MNCLECQEQLQRLLDGMSIADQLALAEHVRTCPPCRELHACARRLLEQLRVQDTPTPSRELAIRIRQSVLNEARRRIAFRRLAAVSAAAACITAVVAGSFFWPRRVAGWVRAPLVEPHRDYESIGGYFFPPSFSSSNLAKGESAAASPFFSVVA